MSKNYNRNDRYDKYSELDNDFEDFGYEVQNVRRQSKKKVTKFKQREDDYYDTFWSGTVAVAIGPWCCIVNESSGIAPWKTFESRSQLLMVAALFGMNELS